MKSHYRLLEGVEPLLERLKRAGVEMHACSNYPVWWRNVEEATALLSRLFDALALEKQRELAALLLAVCTPASWKGP